ncbi:hypothetical protein XMV209_002958 [Aliiroseovarius sp. xm-v-209]|nr:hypothetical protein [Aliiroseovarius sp. xm-m-314]NRP81332.1 hypothetical protein [Aliiroseovarius sp. xm-v-209]NRQ11782.1 hypothetical protein [Aliiroseovarius sp. xm-v-208]
MNIGGHSTAQKVRSETCSILLYGRVLDGDPLVMGAFMYAVAVAAHSSKNGRTDYTGVSSNPSV